MKNILLITIIAAAFAGCSHNPAPAEHTEVRQPSQAANHGYTVKGRVGLSVSKVSSGYDEDAFFTVQVDCNNDRLLSREEQGRVVKIDSKSVSQKQRSVFAAFKRRSERQNKNANARPYLTVSIVSADNDHPCNGNGIGHVLVGYNPTFSSAARK